MIDIKIYNKFSNLTNVYEFTAHCYHRLHAGEYFRHNGFEYLITSDPVYHANQEGEPTNCEADFMAVQLGGIPDLINGSDPESRQTFYDTIFE